MSGTLFRILPDQVTQHGHGLARLLELVHVKSGQIELEAGLLRVSANGGAIALLRRRRQALLDQHACLGLQNAGLPRGHRDGAGHPVAGQLDLALGVGRHGQPEHRFDGARIVPVGLAEGFLGLVELALTQGRLAPVEMDQIRASGLRQGWLRRAGNRFGVGSAGKKGKARSQNEGREDAGSVHGNLGEEMLGRAKRTQGGRERRYPKARGADDLIFHGAASTHRRTGMRMTKRGASPLFVISSTSCWPGATRHPPAIRPCDGERRQDPPGQGRPA